MVFSEVSVLHCIGHIICWRFGCHRDSLSVFTGHQDDAFVVTFQSVVANHCFEELLAGQKHDI